MSRLGPLGLPQLLTDIKTWILSKLDNYVTTNTAQTITGKKLFTASSIQLDNVTSMSDSTMLINTSAAAPRGEFPAEEHRVGRIYIGDNTSYNGAWFIVDPTISTNRAFYRMVTTNPDNTDSARFTIEWNGTKEGVRRRRNISMGDLICATNNTYNIGEPGNVWKEAYINNVHGISDFANITSVTLNANTTLTHAVHGRRIIAVTGTRTLTLPVPENGSWFLIKALDYTVTINPPTGTTIASYPDNAQSIVVKAGETVLLTYNGETEYCCVYTTGNSTALVGRTDTAPSEPKNWFKVASCVCKTTYSDPTISFKVYISHSGNTIGTLTAHCRIDSTVGVTNTANTYLQWQECGEGITLDKYALTTKDVSGTSATIELWCKLEGGYASAKFVRIIEHDITNNINKPVWLLTPTRQADGDLAELSDTDFTNIIYSTLTTLKNNTAGNAKNVTGIVAIANGGTGATTRLSAVKALTNEAVASPTHFLTITTNWGKAGYTRVAEAKTVLGITGDIGSHSDSEYVHKTGDESISGAKTFSNNITINGTYLGTEASTNERTNIYLLANRDTADASGAYISRFRQNRTQGAMGSSDVSYISFDFLENSTRYTRCFTMGLTDWDSDGVSQTYYLTSPGGKGSLGTATTAWNKVYANSYYLGTTAFGDIVTHNASEFLTSHQSLDNYVTTNTAQTITAIKAITGGEQGKMVFKNPNYNKGDANESGVIVSRLYFGNSASYDGANAVLSTNVDSSGNSVVELCAINNTANNSSRASLVLSYDKSTSSRLLKSWGNFLPYIDNTYTLGNSSSIWKECYCNAYYLGTTAFGDIVTHNASEFLTSHPAITLSSNTTSTASPAHGGTFTCIDSVTQDTNGHITKVNTKTVTLPSDNNTDTKVKQYEGTTNNERPILSRYNSTEASQTANFVVYDTGVTSNPAKHTITASGGFIGNASSATEFSANKDVTLTGDVTGTASSKAGWSVATTLANSGVTAGTYGPSADVTGSNNATILVPEITVDAKGRVTAVTNRTYKSVNTDSDKKVYQYYKSDDNVYRLLFSNNAGNTATSNVGAVYSGLNNSFYVNPSTGSLYATKLYSGGTEVKVTDYDTHIADTDIHVTTADKNRWNNQTYVFRYSSTALTPSSTNSNALLDNTDNLKVGDKVIDSSGVLFSITAIDTANSTFTIGTALIDLAKDSDAVRYNTVQSLSTSQKLQARTNIDAFGTGEFKTHCGVKLTTNNDYLQLLSTNNNILSKIPWNTIPNVYNRNEPVVTNILWSGDLNSGDITLSEPFIDYDVLMCVYGTNDNSPGTAPWNFSVIPVWMLKKVIVDKNVFGVVPSTFDIVNDHERRWEIKVADSHFTFFKWNYDTNVKMWRVIGIRYTSAGTGVV